MRPIFQTELVNPPFGDPGLYIDLKFEKRALLFDIGDITALPTRKLLRISDVFVSHTHMDHFAGFDHLLRVCVGRDIGVRLYGPPGFIDQVEHKLLAYTWNLVANYVEDFRIAAHELHPDGTLRHAVFRSREHFRRELQPEHAVQNGILLDESSFRVRTRALDHHGLPSLAFAFEEHTHINVWKNRLEELGLPTGPWLTELKRAVRAGEPDDLPLEVRWRTRDGSRTAMFRLAELRERVLQFVPGQRVCYVTDVAGHATNVEALLEFLRDADVAYLEAVFLNVDRDHAVRKAHLTAAQSGALARQAGVKSAIPFHFSTRYYGREADLLGEFERAYRSEAPSP